MQYTTCILSCALALVACGGANSSGKAEASQQVAGASDTLELPAFDGDSAYAYVEAQVAMGPRVPGSVSHSRCADYLTERMLAFGADTVVTQRGDVTVYDGTVRPVRNILARFDTSAPRRILIAAHYDTRPWADEDADEANRSKPIAGANDGASGVGVILELARIVGSKSPEVGVDFLLTDLEDMGEPSGGDSSEGWCAGARYWAANLPYRPIERPAYGVLLDMVGGEGATFTREYFSERQAPAAVAKVWAAAAAEGVSRFVDTRAGAVTDDHIYISQGGIPCIDIIECAHPATGAFPPYWHTMADDMRNISRSTLEDVGRTLVRVIYTEEP